MSGHAYIVPRRLFRVQVRNGLGIWQDMTTAVPLRTAKAIAGFFERGTTTRFLYHEGQ